MRAIGGDDVWGRYGFADAFNPGTGWISPDVIGIDVGIMMVQAENLRTGFVWETFMRAPEVQRGMRLAGFRSTAQPDDRGQETVDRGRESEDRRQGTEDGTVPETVTIAAQ
jgi:hypothetical protein